MWTKRTKIPYVIRFNDTSSWIISNGLVTIVIYSNGVEHFKALFKCKPISLTRKILWVRNMSLSSESSHGNQWESTQKLCDTHTHAQHVDSVLYWKICVLMRNTLAAFVPSIAGIIFYYHRMMKKCAHWITRIQAIHTHYSRLTLYREIDDKMFWQY